MSRKTPIPAIAHLRTSSAGNVGADKDSDKRQRQAIEGFARHAGYELVGEFYDAAGSGADPIQLKVAADHVGIAELACFLGDASSDLVRLWPKEPPTRRAAWLIVHQDMRRSARIRAVSAAIGDEFRRQRQILEKGSRRLASSP